MTLEEVNSIPIFDSLSHPTINSNWISPRYDGQANINMFSEEMIKNNICGTFAVGMKGVGNYEEDEYIKHVNEGGDVFFPIAFFDFNNLNDKQICEQLKSIKRKGYVGIKLHPRFGNFYITDKRLPYIIDVANSFDLIPLLCTFFYTNQQKQSINNIDNLGDMLMAKDKDSDLILLHGGLTRLLETMELVRFFPNVILDLSLTMSKYEGTHLDYDIDYIFRLFDRRTTIGTDSPEISHSKLRERFNRFALNTSLDKAENIAYKNISVVFDKHSISHTFDF